MRIQEEQIWNAFPFHPFKGGNERSNRTPTDNELKMGERFLKELIGLFNIETVVAIGNRAEATLRNMRIVCKKVRHPANGGKIEFVSCITGILGLK